MNTEYPFRKVGFLDTNSLHFISLYMSYAEKEHLYPFESDATEATEAIGIAKGRLQETQGQLRESLLDGLEIISWMKTNGAKVEYSPMTRLELLTGRLRGRALQAAATEGIPDRMWNHFWADEEEIYKRLTPKDLEDTYAGIDSLEAVLTGAGIEVSVDVERARDVLELANVISERVYVQAVDCVIYASAVVARADHLITRDSYLRKTVNRIRTGSEKTEKEIQERIVKVIGDPSIGLPDGIAPKKLNSE